MNFLVDVGNTRIKWAFQYEDELSPGASIDYEKAEFSALAHTNWGKLDIPRRVLVANVAGGGLEEQISTWVVRRWRIDPEFLVAEKQGWGVTNGYTEPRQLGADRWACLLAARSQISGPACIVDCGTAITIDVLSDSGEHMGGLILPGIQMMQQSLVGRTSQITSKKMTEDLDALQLGRSTQLAVENGCFYSAVTTIERVVTEFSEVSGDTITTVITGGDADRVSALLAIPVEKKPDLVLQGLAVVAGTNL